VFFAIQSVSDFNTGTLIRTDGADEYTQHNTIFVLRIQFYVFEIARCRRGLNDWIWTKAKEEAAEKVSCAVGLDPYAFAENDGITRDRDANRLLLLRFEFDRRRRAKRERAKDLVMRMKRKII
jgi:Polysaccharide biosynthesis